MLLEVEAKEQNFEVYYSLAFGYFKLKNFKQAFKFLQLAKGAPQADIRASLLTAKCHKKTGDLNKALEVLLKLNEQEPGNLEALFLTADVYRLKGCFNNAVEYFDVR